MTSACLKAKRKGHPASTPLGAPQFKQTQRCSSVKGDFL